MAGTLQRKTRKVAVFIDVANACELDMTWIMRTARRLGRIELARGYGSFSNWRYLAPAAEKLFLLGVELIHAPAWRNGSGEWKDAADELMIANMSDVLATRLDIERFVVCSGDAHFVPVVRQARARGCEVIVIGPSNGTSRLLMEAANRCLTAPSAGIVLPLEHEFTPAANGGRSVAVPGGVRHQAAMDSGALPGVPRTEALPGNGRNGR